MMNTLWFTNKSIRLIFLVSICIGILFPLINIYYIYPYFTDLLVKNTEEEAVRLGTHLAGMYFKDGKPLSREKVLSIEARARRHIDDFHLMKLKIFSPSGEIIYSTDKKDVGKINNKDYFHNIVAKGAPFTKIVRKDTQSLEGQKVTADVVETYVPVMEGGKFVGAFEIYYDITTRSNALHSVIYKSSVIPFLTMLIFLIFITGILIKLDSNLIKQNRTEEELKLYTEKLHSKNRELQDFAHISSHDLQEPLRKVMAFGDRLKRKYAQVLDEQGCDYLARMQNAARRMEKLIQGLLTFSRVTTKAKPFEPVDLDAVAQDVLSDLEVRIQDTGARIEVEQLPKVSADPLQMRQLFQNLIGNALKFHKEEQHPVVRIIVDMFQNNKRNSGNEKYYKITFEDNGIGFDDKYEDRIFGVFQRLHGRNEYEGSGIGLSVCKKIAERHGGNISAQGTPGVGAKFTVTLLEKPKEGANNG